MEVSVYSLEACPPSEVTGWLGNSSWGGGLGRGMRGGGGANLVAPPPPTPMPGMGLPRAGGAGSLDMAGGGRLGKRPDLGPETGNPAVSGFLPKSPENCR